MSTKDIESEEIRLASAQDLMYGNKDLELRFPFDVKDRFSWVIFTEKLLKTEDGQAYSALTSQKYQIITTADWDRLFEARGKMRGYFEKRGLSVTILHDPYLQASFEGTTIKGGAIKQASPLTERLKKVKSASDFKAKATQPVEEALEVKEEISSAPVEAIEATEEKRTYNFQKKGVKNG
jgi:hypothetical protein